MSIYSFNKPEPVKPTEKEAPVLDKQEEATIDKMAQQEGKSDGKTKVIVVDGPLSEVYTKALNVALANESVMIVAATNKLGASGANQGKLTNDSFNEEEKDEASYVYALGDKLVDNEAAMEAYNNLTKAVKSGKYKKVHMAIEGVSGDICNRLSFVIEGAMAMGVNLVLNQTKGTDSNIDKITDSI